MKNASQFFFSALLFSLLFFTQQVKAQYIQSYQTAISIQGMREPSAFYQCSNSDLVLAWSENTGTNFSSYSVICRTDSLGNLLWSIKLDDFDSISRITLYSIGENANGNIWLFGIFESSMPVFVQDFFIAELTSSGSLIWSKFYAINNTYVVGNPSCHKMYDDGYMIRISLDMYIQLLRTDASGNLRWGKMYSTDTTGNKFRVRGVQTPDSGFVMIGKSGDYLSYIKIDTAGNILQSYRMQGWWSPGDGALGAMCLLADNSVLVGGRSDFDPFLMKFDPNGNPLWIKTYTSTAINTDFIFLLHTASDGTVFATGTRDAPINVSALGELFQFDTSGNVLQAAAYFDNTLAPASTSISMLGTNDEVFVLENNAAPGSAMRTFKIGHQLDLGCNMQSIPITATNHTPSPIIPVSWTSTDGQQVSHDFSALPYVVNATLLCDVTGIPTPPEAPQWLVYPNPSLPTDFIQLQSSLSGSWYLIDAAGRCVAQGRLTGTNQSLSLPGLSSGVYTLRIIDDHSGTQLHQKLIRHE